MMSTALSTSRANSRSSKEKSSKTATQAQNAMKIDGPPKVQVSPSLLGIDSLFVNYFQKALQALCFLRTHKL